MRSALLSTLASLAAHGAVVVVAALQFIDDRPADRPACVLGFHPDEASGPVDAAADEPPPADLPRPDVGTVVEAQVLDEAPPEESKPLADAEPVAEPTDDDLPTMPTDGAERAPTVLPSLTAIPPRPRSSARPT